MTKYKTLWHVSPRGNLININKNGIDPSFARGDRKLIWLVSWWSILWALAHTSNRHRVAVCDLICFKVRVPVTHIKHFNGNRYYSDCVIKPIEWRWAADVLNTIELNRTRNKWRVFNLKGSADETKS